MYSIISIGSLTPFMTAPMIVVIHLRRKKCGKVNSKCERKNETIENLRMSEFRKLPHFVNQVILQILPRHRPATCTMAHHSLLPSSFWLYLHFAIRDTTEARVHFNVSIRLFHFSEFPSGDDLLNGDLQRTQQANNQASGN